MCGYLKHYEVFDVNMKKQSLVSWRLLKHKLKGNHDQKNLAQTDYREIVVTKSQMILLSAGCNNINHRSMEYQ